MFLLFVKSMLGTRAKIVFLSLFFTFSFALLFLALVKNYAQAGTLLPVRFIAINNVAEIPSSTTHEIIPYFGVEQSDPIPWFDLDNDDSYQRYLSTDHSLTDSSYVPADLVSINSNFTANNSKPFKLREEAALQFADMARHFRNAFSWDRLWISSAWRSKWFQDSLLKQGCSLKKCAQIGTSEHQLWLAVDIKIISRWWRGYSLDITPNPNKYYDWLKANAARFGFHNTYQKWVEVDGKIVEWRHRRYVWVELATILMDNDQSFAEYYNITNN